MMNDNLPIFGYVTAEMYESNNLIQTIEQPNLIVNVGKNALAKRIAFTDEPLIEKISIGTGSLTPLFDQTELDSPVATRTAQFTLIEENNVVKYIVTFPEGIGTGNITEVGLFDTADTMISRTLLQTPFNKGPTRFLNITWRLQVA